MSIYKGLLIQGKLGSLTCSFLEHENGWVEMDLMAPAGYDPSTNVVPREHDSPSEFKSLYERLCAIAQPKSEGGVEAVLKGEKLFVGPSWRVGEEARKRNEFIYLTRVPLPDLLQMMGRRGLLVQILPHRPPTAHAKLWEQMCLTSLAPWVVVFGPHSGFEGLVERAREFEELRVAASAGERYRRSRAIQRLARIAFVAALFVAYRVGDAQMGWDILFGDLLLFGSYAVRGVL